MTVTQRAARLWNADMSNGNSTVATPRCAGMLRRMARATRPMVAAGHEETVTKRNKTLTKYNYSGGVILYPVFGAKVVNLQKKIVYNITANAVYGI